MEISWHSLKIEEIFKNLATGQDGLSKREVQIRQKKFGLNKLPEERKLSGLKIFLSQFESPLVYILIIAAVICFLLRDFKDGFFIFGAALLNAFIGFFQENKAEKTLWQLKRLVEYKAKVWREKRECLVKTEELVPGDIIIVEAGDKVPADSRLIENYNLQVNEAALTGESIPSPKSVKELAVDTSLADRENMIFLGTYVEKGKGKAIVVKTGLQTELGKITLLVKETEEEKTPLQRKFSRLTQLIALTIFSLSILIFILGLIEGRPFLEIFLVTVAVAVAAVPESLPIALTVCLTIGMLRILKRKALVRRLIAAETLGSTTVICSDKTGTLTEGKMIVDHLVVEGKEKTKLLALKIGFLCNNVVIENPEDEIHQWRIFGDSTEQALFLAGLQVGLDKNILEREIPRVGEIPFDSERMWMATLHNIKNQSFLKELLNDNSIAQVEIKNIIFVKGAPERILNLSDFLETEDKPAVLTEQKKKEILVKFENLTSRGLRVLAVAYKIAKIHESVINDTNNICEISDKLENVSEIKNLIFVGLVALKDPLRAGARITIQECQQAGLRPIIVTGDHQSTARIIAQEVGLIVKDRGFLEGRELDQLTDKELSEKIKKINVFARVEPRHKIRIIDILKKQNEVVAMTGDGVNDAPALKKADIGIAFGSGTDVAKEAADIILMDNNFKTIVKAVEEGRVIFENLKKVIVYLLSNASTQIILILGSLILKLPLPLTAIQILWINLVQDSLPAIALAYEKKEKEIIRRKLIGKDNSLLDKKMKFLILGVSSLINFLILFLFWYLYLFQTNLLFSRLQTIIFASVTMATLFYAFGCRSLQKSIFKIKPFSNKFFTIGMIISFFLLFLAIFLPPFQLLLKITVPEPVDWLVILGVGIFSLLGIEITKAIFNRKK